MGCDGCGLLHIAGNCPWAEDEQPEAAKPVSLYGAIVGCNVVVCMDCGAWHDCDPGSSEMGEDVLAAARKVMDDHADAFKALANGALDMVQGDARRTMKGERRTSQAPHASRSQKHRSANSAPTTEQAKSPHSPTEHKRSAGRAKRKRSTKRA